MVQQHFLITATFEPYTGIVTETIQRMLHTPSTLSQLGTTVVSDPNKMDKVIDRVQGKVLPFSDPWVSGVPYSITLNKVRRA